MSEQEAMTREAVDTILNRLDAGEPAMKSLEDGGITEVIQRVLEGQVL